MHYDVVQSHQSLDLIQSPVREKLQECDNWNKFTSFTIATIVNVIIELELEEHLLGYYSFIYQSLNNLVTIQFCFLWELPSIFAFVGGRSLVSQGCSPQKYQTSKCLLCPVPIHFSSCPCFCLDNYVTADGKVFTSVWRCRHTTRSCYHLEIHAYNYYP